ncbi:recombination regulator RecX [Vibrio sp. B1FLJ16]|uniref:recombination regulator RecX n=1 Tax=Vibrio sp. B1FLJ16 TaxID=2751178 RepID=UPI0015F591CC|nr:recombination regulator RecX [Vibrio sp. B1FLJ16]CAD7811784.1 Regulatory protein RecX [Vibrio sp. B1FLJ16]CAE6917147.1 Regulatory protein RecX [Vibrio sp. B1FLJ16]
MYQKRQVPTLSSKEAAIHLLSRRDHGQYELYQKLALKGYEEADIEAAINFCLDHNYLDDLRYAKSQIRQHVYKGHGERRIRQELNQKRVAESVIDEAIAEEPQDWFELARMAAEKKFKGMKAKDQKEYAKQVRFMQYRGYSFDQISYALNFDEHD